MAKEPGAGSPLSVLGFTAAEDRVYHLVLRSAAAAEQDVAASLGTTLTALRHALHRLVAAGLVEVDHGVVRPSPPEDALGRLIAQEARRQQNVAGRLESLRAMLPALAREHRSAQAPRGELFALEVFDGGDVVDLIGGLAATSTGDLLWLIPDQWRSPFGRELDDLVIDLIRSGRRSRAIYPARVLEEAPGGVRARAGAGEHVRVLASVPTRLAIAGGGVALMPGRWGVHDERRIVVRQESIVSALTMLFESMWERAVSVPGLDGRVTGASRFATRRLLLDQLGSGANDEQIARSLGLSLRTVRRRVAEILDELGVDSRFQAGVEAVRRGWV